MSILEERVCTCNINTDSEVKIRDIRIKALASMSSNGFYSWKLVLIFCVYPYKKYILHVASMYSSYYLTVTCLLPRRDALLCDMGHVSCHPLPTLSKHDKFGTL